MSDRAGGIKRERPKGAAAQIKCFKQELTEEMEVNPNDFLAAAVTLLPVLSLFPSVGPSVFVSLADFWVLDSGPQRAQRQIL
jgi:hypothetical protein